jgi:lysophospholipase L1-like esterase
MKYLRLVAVWSVLIGAICLSGMALGQTVDLGQRYPATLEFSEQSVGYQWTSTPQDIWRLKEFTYNLVDKFSINLGPSQVVFGCQGTNVLWAVVIPDRPGEIAAPESCKGEHITGIFMRFHPARVSELFPAATFLQQGDPEVLSEALRIVALKARQSYSIGDLLVIPPKKYIFFDMETQECPQWFYWLDTDTGVVHGLRRAPSFSWTQACRQFLIENMNNPIVLSFDDGTAFFAGVAAVALSLLLLVRFRTRLAAALLIVVAFIGIAVAISSATPLPVWAYAVWLGAVTATIVLCLWRPTPKARIASAGVLLATSIGMCTAEIPYHLVPRLSIGPNETIYVVGDSLSSGVDEDRTGRPSPKLRCWPAVLGDMTHLTVVNLAKPGAKVQSALEQVEFAKQTNAVVILEIGGNDMFSDVAIFRRQLDTLVSSLQGHRAILMFELPLFPFQNAFGKAQREVAAKYGVILIPKRCLTAIWSSSGGTLDSLHFSQTGHDFMARMVAEVLKVEDGASPHKD